MTDAQPRVSDEELSAYVDGELDPDRREQVAAAIASDPDLAAKFASYGRQNEQLHTLYDGYAEEPIPQRLLAAASAAPAGGTVNSPPTDVETSASPPAKSTWFNMAAAVALFVAGGLAGWYAQSFRSQNGFLLEPIVRQAVLAHQIIEPEAPDETNLLRIENDDIVSVGNLSADFDVPIRAPALRELGSYTPVAFRKASGATGPTAQLLYRDTDRRFISLYVKPHSTRRGLPFNTKELDGYNTVYWIDGPLTYVLVGRKDPADLADMAQAIYRSRGISETRPAVHTTE